MFRFHFQLQLCNKTFLLFWKRECLDHYISVFTLFGLTFLKRKKEEDRFTHCTANKRFCYDCVFFVLSAFDALQRKQGNNANVHVDSTCMFSDIQFYKHI